MQLALFPTDPAPALARDAAISPCGLFRWWLSRHWGPGESLLWVMLNPSTADGLEDDPTLRRIIGFSRRWGYGGLRVVNLYPFRSPHPAALARWLAEGDGVAEAMEENRRVATAMAREAAGAVVAWGANAGAAEADAMAALLAGAGLPLWCLGGTAAGAPIHPLARGRMRVPDDAPRRPYPARAPQ